MQSTCRSDSYPNVGFDGCHFVPSVTSTSTFGYYYSLFVLCSVARKCVPAACAFPANVALPSSYPLVKPQGVPLATNLLHRPFRGDSRGYFRYSNDAAVPGCLSPQASDVPPVPGSSVSQSFSSLNYIRLQCGERYTIDMRLRRKIPIHTSGITIHEATHGALYMLVELPQDAPVGDQGEPGGVRDLFLLRTTERVLGKGTDLGR